MRPSRYVRKERLVGIAMSNNPVRPDILKGIVVGLVSGLVGVMDDESLSKLLAGDFVC